MSSSAFTFAFFSLITVETMNGAPPQPDQQSPPTATQLYFPSFPLCPLYQVAGLLWVFCHLELDSLCQGPSLLSQWLQLNTPGASPLGHPPPCQQGIPSLCTVILKYLQSTSSCCKEGDRTPNSTAHISIVVVRLGGICLCLLVLRKCLCLYPSPLQR